VRTQDYYTDGIRVSQLFRLIVRGLVSSVLISSFLHTAAMFNWLADKQTFREGPFEFRINEARPPQSSTSPASS
jgi:hypothetical protein